MTHKILFFSRMLKMLMVLAMCLAFALLCNHSAKAKTVYEISDEASTVTVETYTDSVDAVLDEAGVDLSATDFVEADATEGAVQLSITHAQYATVVCDGATVTAQIEEGDTVATLLEKLNITVGEDDILSHDPTAIVSAGDTITVHRVTITYYTEESTTPYDTATICDPTMSRGTTAVVQAGVDGRTVYTYEQKSIDGGEPVTTLVQTDTYDMQTEITAYGTRVYFQTPTGLSQSKDYITNIDDRTNTITLASGATYHLSKTVTCSCTAYTAKSGAHTASGRKAQVGVVSVDTSVFPMGTKLLIQSSNGSFLYGVAVAGDTGSAVKGNTIDLYFDSVSECYSFGRRTCTVYVLS
ncbi:MAG: G5 domain-containing protein [Clostridiales bacterium]|nr:G5 domain-containing protein [Clostridiales bacterium]